MINIYLGLIIFIGLLFRLVNLNQSLWLDEAITAVAVKSDTFVGLITKFSPGDFHPPLYYLFLKLWTNLFGYSEIALRIPSVIFGVLTIFVVYKIGKKLFNEKTGLVAALLIATNPLAIYYSQEARMYSLAALAVGASIWFFLEKKWFWFWISFWVATMSDYLPLLMFPVFFFFATNRKKFLTTFAGYLLFVIPWVPFFIGQLKAGLSLAKDVPLWSQVVGGFDPKSFPLTFVKLIFGRISFDNKYLYGLIAGGTGVFYGWILAKSRNKFLWAWLLFPLVIAFALSWKISVFTYFRFLFVLPAFMLLLAKGLEGKKVLIALILLIQFSALVYFNLNPKFWRENWYGAAQYMETPNSLAIMPSLAQSAPLAYYGFKTPLIDVSQPVNLAGVSTVYLIRYVPEIFDPKNIALKKVETSGYNLIDNKNFNGVVVWKYIKK